jgi:hypothetical protein
VDHHHPGSVVHSSGEESEGSGYGVSERQGSDRGGGFGGEGEDVGNREEGEEEEEEEEEEEDEDDDVVARHRVVSVEGDTEGSVDFEDGDLELAMDLP